MKPQTMCDTDVPRAATVDDQYNAGNTAPFAPLTSGDLSDIDLNVEGWACVGYTNQTEADCECYELVDGEWVHVETETNATDEHYITWTTDDPLPSYPETDRGMVILEYSDGVVHYENGEPVEMAPGYVLTAYAGNEGYETPVGEIALGAFRNIAAALEATLAYLQWAETTEEAPADFNPGEGMSMDDLLEGLGLPPRP